jgi:uncharacterized protein (TIGR02246 family)
LPAKRNRPKIAFQIGEEPLHRSILFALAFTLVAAPAVAQSMATIQKLDAEWDAAFNKGDAAAVAAFYTHDAYTLPPGRDMVQGRNAIEALWRQEMQQIGDIKCTPLNVKPLGPRAAREVGTCTFKTKAQPPEAGLIKYLVVWEKSGQNWKLLTDIWNSNK